MIRVVIADDHTLFRQGLSLLFRDTEGFELLGEAADGDALVQTIVDTRPHVALVDVSMPGLHIEELPQALRQRGLDTRVIALTLHTEPQTARRVLQAGVAGYVLKTTPFEELLVAVRLVAGGAPFVSPVIAAELLQGSRDQAPSLLTPREQEVLRWIAAGRPNKQIAAQLQLSVHTVETYRTNLMRKLGLHSTAELVRYAMEQGLVEP
jgi:DNA-binding NarL/FixJ family response regulator